MNSGYGSGKDTLQTALRDLYVKLGGAMADVAEEDDINRLIRDIGNLDIGSGGGGSDVLVVTVNGSGPYSLDKTAGEIFAACQAKKLVVVYASNAENAGSFSTIAEYDVDEYEYYTFQTRGSSTGYFYADSADDYPATQS